MTVDEFLGWVEGREGRWELDEGRLIEKSPERSAHAATKAVAASAIRSSIRRTGAPCHVMPDGALVRISSATALEPDMLVHSGPRALSETGEVKTPVVVIEVLSDATAARDQGPKLAAYFSVPSVAHYLILDPERRTVIHHWRGAGGAIAKETLTDGPLTLNPPGLAFFVEELFTPG